MKNVLNPQNCSRKSVFKTGEKWAKAARRSDGLGPWVHMHHGIPANRGVSGVSEGHQAPRLQLIKIVGAAAQDLTLCLCLFGKCFGNFWKMWKHWRLVSAWLVSGWGLTTRCLWIVYRVGNYYDSGGEFAPLFSTCGEQKQFSAILHISSSIANQGQYLENRLTKTLCQSLAFGLER